nr:rhodanese-like domain-containing protein [uncultured Sulfurimonas sp.]
MKYLLLLSISFFTLFASDAFITTNELKNILEDKNLIIIDVADATLYETSHIKGAISADVQKFVSDGKDKKALINSTEIIQDELRELGINEDSKVVIYSHNQQNGILNSSYLAFILLYSGFENVSILDGGYMAWIFENERLTSTQQFQAENEGNIVVKPNKNLTIDKDYVQNALASSVILDARSPQLYYGTQRSDNIRNVGHISYSKSSFYMDKFLRDNTLRTMHELDEIYLYGHELNQNNEVIVYAEDAFSASMEFFILYKHMGFKNTKLYEASLLEWGNDLDLPMTRFKWE